MNNNIVVLISGRGTNLSSLINSPIKKNISLVISNNPNAKGLQIAKEAGIATLVIDHKKYADRVAFDNKLIESIVKFKPKLVVLAGFMRILTAKFITTFYGKLINIHPSLLPLFPGLHTHKQALQAGVKLHGCSVHFVDEGVDSGLIIAQGAVPVLDDDSEDELASRVLKIEHKILPKVVLSFLENEFHLQNLPLKILWNKKNESVTDYLISLGN